MLVYSTNYGEGDSPRHKTYAIARRTLGLPSFPQPALPGSAGGSGLRSSVYSTDGTGWNIKCK